MNHDESLLALGRVVATPAVLTLLARTAESPTPYLRRHQAGDFGELDGDDSVLQRQALLAEADLESRERMISVYRLGDGTILWVITEADRSSTCLLLPHEY